MTLPELSRKFSRPGLCLVMVLMGVAMLTPQSDRATQSTLLALEFLTLVCDAGLGFLGERLARPAG